MNSWRAVCETVHNLALALWLGVVVSAGAFAAIVFPTMKGLNPRLPDFERYEGEHWRIAGGKIAQKVFLLADVAQFGCAIVALSTLLCMLVLFGLPRTRPAIWVRSLALGIALACAAGLIIIVAPQLNAALKLHWAAAAAGDSADAAAHKLVVDGLHPVSSWLLSGTAISVLIALTTSLWSSSRAWAAPGAGVDGPGVPSPYPQPTLGRGRRA